MQNLKFQFNWNWIKLDRRMEELLDVNKTYVKNGFETRNKNLLPWLVETPVRCGASYRLNVCSAGASGFTESHAAHSALQASLAAHQCYPVTFFIRRTLSVTTKKKPFIRSQFIKLFFCVLLTSMFIDLSIYSFVWSLNFDVSKCYEGH